MISKLLGLCSSCNQKHKPPASESLYNGQSFKITVYNTICSSCIGKDYAYKNMIFHRENALSIHNGRRKIVLVDASTNTETVQNLDYRTNQVNPSDSTSIQEKTKIDKGTSSNHEDIHSENHTKVSEKLNTPSEERRERCLFCEFCNKKFSHAGDLNKHRRKHTGEQPYVCLLCNRKFSHASNLVRHKRLHSGEKPFSCPLKCGETFSRKDKLSIHVTRHHTLI